MSDTKVYLLDGGTLVMDGLHAFWNAGPSGEIRFPVYSVLIDHRDGFYIYDTGYDLDHVQRVLPFIKPMQTKAQTIPGPAFSSPPTAARHQLRHKLAFSFRSLWRQQIFEPCMHRVPCQGTGGVRLPAAVRGSVVLRPFICSGDRRAARRFTAPASEAEICTPTFQTIAGDQEIARGIRLFETPGHAAGHYSLLVELSHRRPMLFTGDASYSQQNLDRMIISSFHLDPVESYKSMQRLKDLAKQYDAEIFCSHDPQAFGNYLKAPGFYS